MKGETRETKQVSKINDVNKHHMRDDKIATTIKEEKTR